jgi:hypothetical protein
MRDYANASRRHKAVSNLWRVRELSVIMFIKTSAANGKLKCLNYYSFLGASIDIESINTSKAMMSYLLQNESLITKHHTNNALFYFDNVFDHWGYEKAHKLLSLDASHAPYRAIENLPRKLMHQTDSILIALCGSSSDEQTSSRDHQGSFFMQQLTEHYSPTSMLSQRLANPNKLICHSMRHKFFELNRLEQNHHTKILKKGAHHHKNKPFTAALLKWIPGNGSASQELRTYDCQDQTNSQLLADSLLNELGEVSAPFHVFVNPNRDRVFSLATALQDRLGSALSIHATINIDDDVGGRMISLLEADGFRLSLDDQGDRISVTTVTGDHRQ